MYPFNDGDTFTAFNSLIKNVTDEIKSLENEYVLKASETELEQHFIERALVDPLVLHVENRYINNQSGTQINVSHDISRAIFRGERAEVRGTRVDIAIPYEGDSMLWRIRASTFSISGYPEIEVRDGEVVFSISFPDDATDSEQLRSDIDRDTESLNGAVRNLANDVEAHNNSVPDIIKQALERKRGLARETTGAIAALGIPVKRVDAEPTFSIPAKRRERPAKRPEVATGDYEPEPALSEQEYQHILEIARSMSLVIERNPSSFESLNEEAIRDHFLLQLNGHYEGGATGETFNASGKTDILIREGNRNVFIAECKFWHGQKAFDDGIDQLLNYLTWRDSKCALLVFNKTKDSSAVRQKMHNTIEARSEHKKTVAHQPDGDSRYILIKESEPGREITLTTQLYAVPTKNVV